jgi:hypothetical protein
MKRLEIYVDKGWNIHTSVAICWISSGARESRVDMMVVESASWRDIHKAALSKPLRCTIIFFTPQPSLLSV